MVLIWLAIAWIVGIVSIDRLYHYLSIHQPIDSGTRVLLPVLNVHVETMVALAYIRWLCIALVVAGCVLICAGLLIKQSRQNKMRRQLRHMQEPMPQTIVHMHSHLVTVGLCIICAACAGLRYQSAHIHTTPQRVWLLAEHDEVIIQGTVYADPKRSEDGQQVLMQTHMAQVGDARSQIDGLLLITLPPYPDYHYGQQLIVQGHVTRPPAARREGGFDYRNYLAREGIFALMHEPMVQALPGNAGNPILVRMLHFRDHCKIVLLRELPEPQASLAVGILLGLKASIPDEVYNAFSTNGTTHILVISGWHLTIVATLFATIARQLRLGRAQTFFVSLTSIWVYALFVGATVAVIRAAIMASLAVLAQATARRTHRWTSLFVACMVLTLHNPHALWSLGFQMSVLATASLFAFAEPMQEWLRTIMRLEYLKKWLHIRSAPHNKKPEASSHSTWVIDTMAVTLAAQILALPIILYHFGNLSIIAPLANIVLVPVVPYAMMLGAIALIVGLICLPLGQLIAPLIAWLPLAWMTEGTRLLAEIPWAAVQLPQFPLWLLISYYGIVTGWWLWKQRTSAEIWHHAVAHQSAAYRSLS